MNIWDPQKLKPRYILNSVFIAHILVSGFTLQEIKCFRKFFVVDDKKKFGVDHKLKDIFDEIIHNEKF